MPPNWCLQYVSYHWLVYYGRRELLLSRKTDVIDRCIAPDTNVGCPFSYCLFDCPVSAVLLEIKGGRSNCYRVTVHNRRGAEFLSQTEQEMILVGGIALFWIGELNLRFRKGLYWSQNGAAALVAWRGFRGESSISSSLANPTTMVANSKAGSKFSNDWPCGPNDVYCMVEEYNYW